MFPEQFANGVIRRHTEEGEVVLDPFAGRGTTLFSAASQGRKSIGFEINPVGYVYAKAKLNPATSEAVEYRLDELEGIANRYCNAARALPRFFHACFCREVRRFLLAARDELDWRRSRTDRTVMALLLVHLHGKLGTALSNQMRQTKSVSPQYALRWWRQRNFTAPEIDPVAFMRARCRWRYAKGAPSFVEGRVYLGDSAVRLERVADRGVEPATLLFTSPPYYGVTNYHYDQWLRLWLLGGPPNARLNGNGRCGKFENREKYQSLLRNVFKAARSMLHDDAVVYVRTDRRDFTLRTTRAVLRDLFPDKRMTTYVRPLVRPSQTRLFRKKSRGKLLMPGEVDLLLRPS